MFDLGENTKRDIHRGGEGEQSLFGKHIFINTFLLVCLLLLLFFFRQIYSVYPLLQNEFISKLYL